MHYLESGLTENFDSRDPNRLFDSSYYNAKNPDVVRDGMNPLVHYLLHGWRESRRDNPTGFNPNRDPNALFDTSYYFEQYDDVLEASYTLDSANPVQHVSEFVGDDGLYANEDRATHPTSASENQVSYLLRNHVLIEEGDPVLPEKAFVFSGRYGEQFTFFDGSGEVKEPPIFYYMENDKNFKKIGDSVFDLLEVEIEATEYFMRRRKIK